MSLKHRLARIERNTTTGVRLIVLGMNEPTPSRPEKGVIYIRTGVERS